MKIGKRQQQGRKGNGRTGEKPKKKCPICGNDYVQSSYGKEKGVMKTIGEYCPDPNCPYITKVKRLISL